LTCFLDIEVCEVLFNSSSVFGLCEIFAFVSICFKCFYKLNGVVDDFRRFFLKMSLAPFAELELSYLNKN